MGPAKLVLCFGTYNIGLIIEVVFAVRWSLSDVPLKNSLIVCSMYISL